VSIQSRLPHLWKEAAVALNNEATAEWTFNYAKKYVLEMVVAKMVKSMSTIPILHAAHQLGYETLPFYHEDHIFTGFGNAKYNRYYSIGVGREASVSISSASGKDAYMSQNIQRDKWLTNTVLNRLQLPVAKWSVVDSEQHLKEIFDDYKKPVVIKPTGLTGGSGVSTGIKDIQKALDAYRYASKLISAKQRSAWQTKIMIQEQVEGEDYRLLVIDGKLTIATKRVPAAVVGDGKKTIKQLIDETNKDPRRDVLDPTHTLKPIVIDEPLKDYLTQQGLTLEDIPAKGKTVPVRKEASMSRGGITEDFTEKVHPQIKYVVESLARSLRAFILGVDVLCKDISKPLTGGNGSIIECNTMPEAYLNAFPVIGKQRKDIGELIVQSLVDTNNPTRKIVFLGGDLKNTMSAIKMNIETGGNESIGIYSDGSIYINSELISEGVETWKAVEALKLNASLSTIVFHYNDLKEIEENGLGFDTIDKIFVTTQFAKDNQNALDTLEGYKNLGLPVHIETL
jgi:cyanophycin synthetase